jgi:hypothetical protein
MNFYIGHKKIQSSQTYKTVHAGNIAKMKKTLKYHRDILISDAKRHQGQRLRTPEHAQCKNQSQ